MKFLVVKLFIVLALGNSEPTNSSLKHSANSGELNIAELDQIESIIRKKAGAELEKNHDNYFTLNGQTVYSKVVVRRYSPSIYEESFQEIENPENEYKIRLVKDINGDRELAIFIREGEQIISYHAVFDSEGIMLEEDPWGKNEGYTIEIFDLYKLYQAKFSQKVDALDLKAN